MRSLHLILSLFCFFYINVLHANTAREVFAKKPHPTIGVTDTVLLASEESSWMTGRIVTIDGGQSPSF